MANQNDYWSELAARLFAQQQFGRPIDKALRDLFFQWGRMDPSTPEKQYWESVMGMARAGQLDYLEPAVPTPPPNLPPVGPGGARTTPVTPTVTPPVTPTVTPVTPVVTPGTPSPPVPVTPTTTTVAPTTTPVYTPEELAAMFISRTQGIPIEAARLALNTPAWAAIKTSLLAAAAAGHLDYLKTPAAGTANPLQALIDALTKSNAAGQYSQLAQALIAAATGLRGPRDYMKFVQSTSAGRTLLEQLYGDRPRPAFSAPTEQMEPLTLQDLINRLGLGGQPAPAQGQPEARDVPMPYQINPAVWDALGPVGQQLTLGMAEGQGWDPDEFLRQFNAARPRGSAPGQTLFQYQSPRGFF